MGSTEITVFVAGAPMQVGMSADKFDQADAQGLVTRLENRIRGLEKYQDTTRLQLDRILKEKTAASDRIGRPFDLEPRLQTLLQRLGP